MHTPNLPIQVNSAGPAPQAQRARNGNAEGNGQFSQALSREIDARKGPMTAPAAPPPPSRPAAPAKAQAGASPQQAQAAQSGKSADKPGAAAGSAAPEKGPGKASGKTETAEAAPVDDPAAEAAAAAAAAAVAAGSSEPLGANPVVDMLNLVASFNQPGAPSAPASTEADAAGAAPGAPPAAAADPLAAAGGKRALLELPADGAALPLPAAAKAPGAGQLVAAAPPVPEGAPAQQAPATAFSNMMAKADPGVLDKFKNAADTGQDGAPVSERAAPQGAAERTLPGKPDAGSVLRAGAEALPAASPRAREVAAEVSQLNQMQVGAPATGPLQQAVMQQAAQAAGGLAAGDKIPARVGTPAWDKQVAQKIVWMVGGEEQSASLTLNPPDLGPMQVVLSVTNDMASVTFSSSQLEVRQALEDAMPKLREMMSENGIALGNASVNDGAPDQQQAEQQQSRRGGGAQQAGNGPLNGSAAEAEARNNARPARVGQLPGTVDTFA